MYPKGTFIYRRTGRSRESSASYYTPESLTRLVVKYALKERIKEDMPAKQILNLTVCEPAMGSGGFLTEAVNQLAEKYLERRQKELGKRIPRADYPDELQRVKHYITDRNVYGVDLNPVAVELGEISLWLNCIGKDGHVPWFGFQLQSGNSLVGARRQVYAVEGLGTGKKRDELWFNSAPERVTASPAPERPIGTVYHFLLPDPGMSDYRDKFVRSLEPGKIRAIRDWRRDSCEPFSDKDIETLESLSETIDQLWTLHTEQLARDRESTRDTVRLWGLEQIEKERRTPNRWKEQIRQQGVFGTESKVSSPFGRLKLAMDYWCALWFWPLNDVELLPSRDEYLNELWFVLKGEILPQDLASAKPTQLFGDEYANHAAELTTRIEKESGLLDLGDLLKVFPRLALVDRLAREYRFHHWELVFSDIFYHIAPKDNAHNGFDIILGNPPWIKVERQEKEVLSDFNPRLSVRKTSGPYVRSQRKHYVSTYKKCRESLLSHICSCDALQGFLGSTQNYALLKGQKTNLFKCFLPQSWMITSQQLGVSAFLHPEGVYDDLNGGALRCEIYHRLCAHFQFQNEQKLFPEIGNTSKFSVNIYSSRTSEPQFHHISNLFTPETVDACFLHDGKGSVPSLKDSRGRWTTEGHRRRIVNISALELTLFSQLLDAEDAEPIQARLPALHSIDLISVLRKLSQQKRKLRDLSGEFHCTTMFDETAAQRAGTIRRDTQFSLVPHDLIYSGPHFSLGNPIYKTPRVNCGNHRDYDRIDLTHVPDDYLPRTNFVPDCSRDDFINRTPVLPWIQLDSPRSIRVVTRTYRSIHREMTSPTLERSLIAALIPPNVGHILTCIGSSFRDQKKLLDFNGLCISLPMDFFVKSLGADHIHGTLVRSFPFPDVCREIRPLIHMRVLALNCLTMHYSQLWRDSWNPQYRCDSWTKSDARLGREYFCGLNPHWVHKFGLRSDLERRQALLEVDVLISMVIGLTLEELISIYRIQFPVMQQYECDTWFDSNGRIIFTASKGLSGVGMPRKAIRGDASFELVAAGQRTQSLALGWEDVRDLREGRVLHKVLDDTVPGDPVLRIIEYRAPFDRCDRESDYRIAWKNFEQRCKGYGAACVDLK